MASSPEQLAPIAPSDEGLPLEMVVLLRPEELLPDGTVNPAIAPHLFRQQRLVGLPGYRAIEREVVADRLAGRDVGSPYMTYGGVLETWAGTQGRYETHRMLTPRLQEIMADIERQDRLLDGIDTAAVNGTDRLINEARAQRGVISCDVAIVGSGPHAAAAAAMIRQEHPDFRIIMIEREGVLGGQWRNNGPEASFSMNSRVRPADNRLPNLPRTPGNINPMGRWATLELSDTVRGNYALNIEMGATAAINAYLNISEAMVDTDCLGIVDRGDSADLVIKAPDGSDITLRAGAAIQAAGIEQVSTLALSQSQLASPRYLRTRDVYRTFGNYERSATHNPLAQFAGRTIIGIGGGDSLLTGIEAVVAGNLPPDSYGPYGVGRYRVGEYIWVGAPGQTASEIARCLRSRYANGLVQALPKSDIDRGSQIRPVQDRARAIDIRSDGVDVLLDSGDIVSGDVIFDHTNSKSEVYGARIFEGRRDPRLPRAVFGVGPGARPQLRPDKQEALEALGIPQNRDALWATIELTDDAARLAGRRAAANVAPRRR